VKKAAWNKPGFQEQARLMISEHPAQRFVEYLQRINSRPAVSGKSMEYAI